MRAFLTKIEDFFASLFSKEKAKEKQTDEKAAVKKFDIFSRLDAFLARYDGSFLTWSFFLSAVIMLLIYVAMGVYPFGTSSVLVLDLNGQYVQFFAGLRAILKGDGSLLYSFSRSLGGEFLGIFAYYLASPFSWLVALFPEKNILEALLCMFVLKSGFSGLHFGAFLHYTRRPPKMITIGLSVLYAISSYAVVMQHNTMWIDGMMLLPLLLLGVERLVRYKKPFLYTVTLALTLLSNYYIGYMMCIFTAIYFFYFFLAGKGSAINPRNETNHFLKSFLRMGVFTVIGIGISALLLLPAYYSLTFGKTGFSQGNFSFTTKFDIIDFIAKMFPGAYDTVRPEGLPWVYSGTLSLILLPIYFLAQKIPVREKIASGALLLFLFLSMYINTLDILWHGGQAPNWLNYRYSFVYIFVVLLLSARALMALKSVDYRAILAVFGVLILFVVVLQKLGLTYTTNGATNEYFDDLSGVWLSIGCLALYGIILLFLNGHDRTSPRYETIATLLVAVLCVEVLLNGVFYLRRQNEDVVISNYASYHDFYDVYDAPFDYVKENDTDLFYRMDKTFQHTVCDSFVLGYNGLASSTSTLNADTVKFQHLLGMKANSHWTEATGSTIVTNTLLGVKYWVAKDGEAVDPLYTEYHRDGDAASGTATVTYQNPYALPIAFAVSPLICDLSYYQPMLPYTDAGGTTHYGDFNSSGTIKDEYKELLSSPFERANATFSTLTGNENIQVYQPIVSEYSFTGTTPPSKNYWGQLNIESAKDDTTSRLVFTLTAPSNAPIYCYFPSYYPREATLYVNDEKQANVLYPDCANLAPVISLGSFSEGETVTVSLSFEKYGEFYLLQDIPYFYTVDENGLRAASEILKRGGIQLEKAEDDHFIGTISARTGFTTVQTTIPYDEGWQITANGERVEVYETMGALLAFNLPSAGDYEIEMRYRPRIYTVGLIVSIFSSVLLAALITLSILHKKGKLQGLFACRFGAALLFLLPSCPLAEAPLFDEEAPAGAPKETAKPKSNRTVKHSKKRR